MSTTNYEMTGSDLYDPELHHNQIVAVYSDHAAAQRAHDALVQAGIPASAIDVLDRGVEQSTSTVGHAENRMENEGFWGAVKNLFAPEDDYHAYNHAIEHGHAMVVVTPTAEMDRHHVIEVLERSDPIDFDERQAEWRDAGYGRANTAAPAALATGVAGTTTPAVAAAPVSATGNTAAAMTGDDKIQVVQERLRVGKREVAQGAVRVRSYVVERPVEEQVRLRSETVTIDRHPVDRALEPGVDAFKDRTVEVHATSEEAIVSKEARVVEEIGVRKDVAERTETVRDSVRETKVDVEDATATMGNKVDNRATPKSPI